MPIYIGSASVRLYYVNWFILFWENFIFFFLSIATCIIFHSISLPWHLFYYHILVMQSLGMLQLSKYEEKKFGGKPKISKNLLLDEYVYLCQQFSYLNLLSCYDEVMDVRIRPWILLSLLFCLVINLVKFFDELGEFEWKLLIYLKWQSLIMPPTQDVCVHQYTKWSCQYSSRHIKRTISPPLKYSYHIKWNRMPQLIE